MSLVHYIWNIVCKYSCYWHPGNKNQKQNKICLLHHYCMIVHWFVFLAWSGGLISFFAFQTIARPLLRPHSPWQATLSLSGVDCQSALNQQAEKIFSSPQSVGTKGEGISCSAPSPTLFLRLTRNVKRTLLPRQRHVASRILASPGGWLKTGPPHEVRGGLREQGTEEFYILIVVIVKTP